MGQTYWLMKEIPVVVGAVDFGASVERAFDEFFEWLPALIGALAILVIGFIVARVVGGLVGRALQSAGVDRAATQGQAGSYVSKVTSSPSRLLGRIVFWLVMFGVISLAVSVLGIEALENLVAAVYAYLPNVLAALLIFFVAGIVAGAVAGLVKRTMGETTTGKIVMTVAPTLIMAIAGFMILDQLQIAPQIVTITYAALMGGIALAMALAFGLGGREVAGRMLDGAYQSAQENKEQIKQDLQTGKERAAAEAEKAKTRVEQESTSRPAGAVSHQTKGQ